MTLLRVPYESEHMAAIELREHEAKELGKDRLDRLMLNSVTFSYFTEDGKVLGIAGYYLLWPGVAEVFVVPSVYTKDYLFHFHKTIVKQLRDWESAGFFHRMQTASIDEPATNRWMAMLGFKCEGVLEKYTANQLNFRQWARVR